MTLVLQVSDTTPYWNEFVRIRTDLIDLRALLCRSRGCAASDSAGRSRTALPGCPAALIAAATACTSLRTLQEQREGACAERTPQRISRELHLSEAEQGRGVKLPSPLLRQRPNPRQPCRN